MQLHPITVIEIIFSVVFLSVLFIIAFLIPNTKRKIGLYVASSLAIIVLAFFLIRPHWINYQVSIKTEQLHAYLENKYPGEEWKIKRKTGREYNPYHLEVEFDNEKGWFYMYFVKDADNIKQKGYATPVSETENKEPKHFQSEDW